MGLQRQRKRAAFTLTAAALGSVLLVGGGLGARADDDSLARDQETIKPLNLMVDRVDLANAPLTVAVKLIEQKTGLNIVFLGSMKDYNPVTVSLSKVPVSTALSLIAKAAGGELWEQDGIYFIGPKGYKHEEPVPPPAEGPQIPTEPVRWEKIRLYNTEPQSLLSRIGIKSGPLHDLTERYTEKLVSQIADPMPNPYTFNTGAGNQVRDAGPGPLNQPYAPPSVPTGQQAPYSTNASNLQNLGNGNTSNGPGFLPTGSGATGSDQGAQRDKMDAQQEFGRGGQGFGGGGFGGGGFGGGGFGGGGGFQGGGGRGGAGGFGAGGGQNGLGGQAGAASQLIPDGILDIFGYEPDNSIIVRGRADAIQELRRNIQLLDIAPRQVAVKAEFITVTQNDTDSFGINWSFQKVNLQGGVNTGFSTSNTAFLTYATGNLSAQLSWILTTGRGKIVAAPTATTFNNVPISLSIGETDPVFVSTPVISQNGTVALSTTIVGVPIFTQMTILPRINADNTITVFGFVTIQGTRTFVSGPQGETAPVVTAQAVVIQRRIRNGDTMVIGGLVQKQDNDTAAKVPLLGDLPLIGTLFRSRQVTTADSELLVFITPSIIPESTGGENATARPSSLLNTGGSDTTGPGNAGGGAVP